MSVLLAVVPLAVVLTPAAQAATTPEGTADRGSGQQHGGLARHLPPAHENMELVGKIKIDQPFGNVLEGQFADVAVFKNNAYVMSWSAKENQTDLTCQRGGFASVDISEPAHPVQRNFVPALPETYHGEGAQGITLNTPAFKGDILAVNNEPCGANGVGGFDLYNISDPANPVALVRGAGDRSPDDNTLVQDPAEVPNSSHSIFVWQDGPRAYAVTVDNTEGHDVDIFDITVPTDPEFIADLDLDEMFPNIVDNSANGDSIFFHDVVVKNIGGVQTMLASYWDAGYVKLNVNDPAHPQYLGDTSFDGPDPLLGFDPPEGNAHEAEFSFDNRFVLAADEDFSPYRAGTFSITTGPNAGNFPAQEVSGGTSVAHLPDHLLNGPTVFGGYGCNASTPVPQRSSVSLTVASGEEAILVLERGPADDPTAPEAACFPGEKAANAIAAGWDAVLLVNRHLGDAASDEAFCGSGGFPAGAQIVTLCTTHEAFHRLFGTTPNFDVPVPGGDAPALGTIGEKVRADSFFDGWGYAHLFRNDNGKMAEVGAYAIPESLDPRYASGFGDLSIHEFATDPETNLAYSAYYSGGLRVVRFGDDGLHEVGRFIDEGGNDFWGVEQFTDAAGNRLIAGSDRDYGLYIVKYTGPGAVLAKAPVPPTPPAVVPPGPRPSSFFGFGSLRRVTVSRRQTTATITVPGPGKATARLKASIGGRSVTIARATRTARAHGRLKLTFRLSALNDRLLRRTVAQRRTHRTSGVLQVSFTRTGGIQRTRNKSLAIGRRGH
jgi:hypothetical protein